MIFPIRGTEAEAEELPMLNIEKEEGVKIQSGEAKIQTKTKEVVKELQKTLQTPLTGKLYCIAMQHTLILPPLIFCFPFPIMFLTISRSFTNF